MEFLLAQLKVLGSCLWSQTIENIEYFYVCNTFVLRDNTNKPIFQNS